MGTVTDYFGSLVFDDRVMKATLSAKVYIIQAMREKGYDPYQQLRGYLLENEPGYITRYKDARTLIQTLDMDQVKRFVREMKQ